MPGRTLGAAATALAGLLALAACNALLPSAVPGNSASEPVFQGPIYASLRVTAEPAVATAPLSIELSDPEGGFRRVAQFEVGTIVLAPFPVSSGDYRLIVDDGRCSTELFLAPERETDVVLGLEDGVCEIEVVGAHGEEVRHELGGAGGFISVTVIGGGLVEIRSLDDPIHPVPSPTPPDEGGVARMNVLLPGRYEVVLLRDGVEVDRAEVEVERREPAGDLIEITLGGDPG